ncbi:hypothetical protein [Bradyrhizobium sp. McL0616]|uniref:hypothetical protein n=1 Tax=Bradyrhizobium sp. McL0616 TaxID=3415674 RepID=UPI003CF4FC06
MVRDRRAQLIQSTTTNGIDFVAIGNTAQTILQVHFLNAVPVQGSLTGRITITGGETIPTVNVLPITPADWGWDDGHAVLTLRVVTPGDFSQYLLTIPSLALDSFFTAVSFSFKAGCPSDLDCKPQPPDCPPPAGDAPPIDYLAKDFLSFRQALLDFSTLRYPSWKERSEADFGVMFLEALSAIADDFSYLQDRVAGEASLITATQRRSVRRHAKLVDYDPSPALGATTMLQFDVAPAVAQIPHGVVVVAPTADGTPITFETGFGLRDTSAPPPASSLWNRQQNIGAYWFDDSVQCLEAGATSMFVQGRGYGFVAGQALLIETKGPDPTDPPVRQIVHLIEDGTELCDPLFPQASIGGGPPFMTCPTSPPEALEPTAVTRLDWKPTDELTTARDLAVTTVIGNLAQATQGRTVIETFMIEDPSALPAKAPYAFERTGARTLTAPGVCGDAPPIRLYTLANAPLTWFAQPALDPSGLPVAEILISQASPSGGPPISWNWVRSLLSAGPFDEGFTVEPALYRPIARNSDQSLQFDYDSDAGDTVRFGDSVFGSNPDSGAVFTSTYRFGAGALGNVAAGAISQIDPSTPSASDYLAVMNPFAAREGADAQSLKSVQRLAPQAFRAVKRRAVLAQDYADAAETLPWVKSAGATFRWTGSWLTTFTAAEPKATEQIPIAERSELIELLNRYRMAGTESYAPDPQYVSIDLMIEICAEPTAYAASVEQAVLALLSSAGPRPAGAFFATNRFVFGQPLERSQLEATVQSAPGVAGVTCIQYRRRDLFTGFVEMGDTVPVGVSRILRCDNNPNRPGAGALAVVVRGGR